MATGDYYIKHLAVDLTLAAAERIADATLAAGSAAGLLPLTVVVLVTLCMFWVVVPAMFIGWIAGCSYRLAGPEIDKAQNNGEVV